MKTILLFLALLPAVFAQQATNFADCLCDLLIGVCDVNCCCDRDCDDHAKSVFSQCVDQTERPQIDLTCVPQGSIIFNNTAYVTSIRENNVLCIETDNFKSRQRYNNPSLITSPEQFAEQTASLLPTETVPPPLVPVIAANSPYKVSAGVLEPHTPRDTILVSDRRYLNHFQYGDPIIVLRTSYQLLQYLPQPKAIEHAACGYTAPVQYLKNTDTKCIVDVSNLAELCETDFRIAAETYYKDMKVIKNPGLAESAAAPVTTTNTTGQPPPSTDGTVAIEMMTVRTTQEGTEEAPTVAAEVPSPVFDNGVCRNVVWKVEYKITIDPTAGIQSVVASIHLMSLTADAPGLAQQFSSVFVWANQPDQTTVRSGQLGYPLQGLIPAAIADEFGNVTISRDSPFLTVMRPLGNGVCSQTTTQPVQFGVNLSTGCMAEISAGATLAQCRQLQTDILALLSGPPIDRLASYANSTVEAPDQWLPVLVEGVPDVKNVNAPQGRCSNLVTTAVWHLLYAETGRFDAAQNKIIGARLHFGAHQETLSLCPGSYCQNRQLSDTLRIPVQVSVEFVDVSQPAVPVLKRRPVFDVKFPNDFFYPFTGRYSTASSLSASCMILCVLFYIL